MTVDQWYDKRKGQVLLVPGADPADAGQCMQAADYALNEIYGLLYVWANAIDCWNKFDQIPQLKNNFDKVSDGSIRKGDFVIFNQGVGSVYGHIDLAMQDGTTSNFQGADSNWGGNKTLHLVQHANNVLVIGALRPKGEDMAKPTQKEVLSQFRDFKVRGKLSNGDPSQDQLDYYSSRDWGTLNGDLLDAKFSEAEGLKNELANAETAGFTVYNGKQLYTKD